MTDYRITVSRNDASEETVNLLGATVLPDFSQDIESGNDLVLEDGQVIAGSPQIDAVEVEEL